MTSCYAARKGQILFMSSITNSYHHYVTSAQQINDAVKNEPRDFVMRVEGEYRKDVAYIAKQIVSPENRCRIVMLTGPSASGKTTTAQILGDELKKLGSGAIIISLDNFFLGEARTAPGRDGKPDYESVYALDIPQVHSCMFDLIHYGTCNMPKFNFQKKRPYEKKTVITLPQGHIAIIEGLHALNPIFTDEIHCHGLLKLYVSVKQGVADSNGKLLLSAQNIRFLRRLVRDYSYRRADPEFTFDIWQSVCAGEKKNITPYKKHSDFTLNTIHLYEPCVVGKKAYPLLSQIDQQSRHYDKARRLMENIELFSPLDEVLIPRDSMIREFIGGGSYKY